MIYHFKLVVRVGLVFFYLLAFYSWTAIILCMYVWTIKRLNMWLTIYRQSISW